MTYVELIVVISIIGIVSSIAVLNYRSFQERVEIRNLTSEIALKAVEAQKSALAGKLPPALQQVNILVSPWRPAYGVYFNLAQDNQSFVYFTDLANLGFCDASCDDRDYHSGGYDYLETLNLTGGYTISQLKVFSIGSAFNVPNLSFVFTRPDSGAAIFSSGSVPSNLLYAEITVSSPNGVAGTIKIYPSGRIQVN
jgi:type II secretory pathway pseudopilin PulG